MYTCVLIDVQYIELYVV